MQLYIHIPFCHRICPYCSFYKHTPGNTDMRAFIDAILLEARHHVDKTAENKLTTLYCGGGTPSMLSPTHLRLLFDGLHEIFDFSEIKELTFESNPATFDLKKAQLFKELGITRISLGIQSFDDTVLKTLGREHNREEAMAAVPLLREAGIPEVNIDLMFSIPGQSLESWKDTLRTAVSLKPDHISAYNLTYEEDTAFIDKLTAGEYLDDPEANAKFFTAGHQILTAAGFEHYETSNYAKRGTRSTHNASYWSGANYLGLGPSAVSTMGTTRWKNLPDTANYIKQINHVGHAQTEIEELDADDLHLERIALELRTLDGLDLSILTSDERKRAQSVIDEDMALIDNNRMILTERGMLLVDSIVEHIV
ncbi:radical SAM family heme chaperone HemW [Rubritalea sp.]|uniref:radical SAM family heme chaperone HemW n=1 Tax=Rubritalea sp. TaxID=2109375 RepID=UPI003EF5BA52